MVYRNRILIIIFTVSFYSLFIFIEIYFIFRCSNSKLVWCNEFDINRRQYILHIYTVYSFLHNLGNLIFAVMQILTVCIHQPIVFLLNTLHTIPDLTYQPRLNIIATGLVYPLPKITVGIELIWCINNMSVFIFPVRTFKMGMFYDSFPSESFT